MCGAPSSAFKVLGKRLNTSQGRSPRSKSGISTTVVRCGACRLTFANPMPIPASIHDHYDVPPESYWRESFFADVEDDFFAAELRILSSLRPEAAGGQVLDVGAGFGNTMVALQRAGYEAYGFEPSEPFYERAISKMGISKDRLRLGAMETVDYEEETFEFISFRAVLEHLYDPSASITKAMTWLKPGGVMTIEVPSSDWLISRLLNFYYRARGLDYVTNISPMHAPFHLYEFTRKSFEVHAQQHGYNIVRHEVYVCDTYLPKIADRILRPYMERTKTGMQLSMWLQKPEAQ